VRYKDVEVKNLIAIQGEMEEDVLKIANK